MKTFSHALIIRTRNRPALLRSCLQFYEKTKFPGTIYVADDSDTEGLGLNKSTILDFSESLALEHIFVNRGVLNKNRGARVVSSTIETLGEITEEFFTIFSDDDVSLIHLDYERFTAPFRLDPNVSAVHAPEIKIKFLGDSTELDLFKIWPSPFGSVFDRTALERLASYFFDTSLAYFGLVKTSLFQGAISKYIDTYGAHPFMRDEDNSLWWYDEELPWNALIYIVGKVVLLPRERMTIRAVHSRPDGVTNQQFNPHVEESAGALRHYFDRIQAREYLHQSALALARLVHQKDPNTSQTFSYSCIIMMLNTCLHGYSQNDQSAQTNPGNIYLFKKSFVNTVLRQNPTDYPRIILWKIRARLYGLSATKKFVHHPRSAAVYHRAVADYLELFQDQLDHHNEPQESSADS